MSLAEGQVICGVGWGGGILVRSYEFSSFWLHYCAMLFSGETNLDGLMTTQITAIEEHHVQLEREIQEAVCAQQ